MKPFRNFVEGTNFEEVIKNSGVLEERNLSTVHTAVVETYKILANTKQASFFEWNRARRLNTCITLVEWEINDALTDKERASVKERFQNLVDMGYLF